jgi:hypothetical protein
MKTGGTRQHEDASQPGGEGRKKWVEKMVEDAIFRPSKRIKK